MRSNRGCPARAGRNPLRTGLGSARCQEIQQQPGPDSRSCRNPLRTGLGSARDVLSPSVREAVANHRSQSPENGSRLCKQSFSPRLPTPWPRFWSQSPENGSRLCKAILSGVVRKRRAESRNPLRTGLGSASAPERATIHRLCGLSQSPENGSRLCKAPQGPAPGLAGLCRNPLRTGLGSARRFPEEASMNPVERRNPLRTGLGSARRCFL